MLRPRLDLPGGQGLVITEGTLYPLLSRLRKSGLVETRRDTLDGRWVYYSLNRDALDDLNQVFGNFFDPARIKPRRPNCGPEGALVPLEMKNKEIGL